MYIIRLENDAFVLKRSIYALEDTKKPNKVTSKFKIEANSTKIEP